VASDWVGHGVLKAVEREKAENRQILFPISLGRVDTHLAGFAALE
jgi:hypothetical protein